MAGLGDSSFDENQEVRLWETAAEKKRLAAFEDLYSIINATELLEAAYVKDAMTPEAYASRCTTLIGHFENVMATMTGSGLIRSAEDFMREYKIDAPRAHKRLVIDKVPATALHKRGKDNTTDAYAASQLTLALVSTNDHASLDLCIDELLPDLQVVLDWINASPILPADWEPTKRILVWHSKMRAMPASDNLSPEDKAQFMMELNLAREEFNSLLRRQ
jgi:ESCRT-I complex subunit VPS28